LPVALLTCEDSAMSYLPRALRLSVALCFLAHGIPLANAQAAEGKKPDAKAAANQFARIKRDASGQPVALETAIVRYEPVSGEGGLTVDLIGAIHVADRPYYEQLNKQFEQYDVLLYELVAPQGTRIPKGGKRDSGNPINLLQQVMKTVLDLDSQTERIDYTKKNFVHADLSPEGMAEAMRNRGDTGLTVILSVASDLLRQQNLQELTKQGGQTKEEDPDILSLLLDPSGSAKLKRIMAEQMIQFTTGAGGLGNTLNTILVTDRNKAAIKVLQAQLAKGKKKIGIFYGLAHLNDFDRRLREDFGLKRSSEQWLTAWDLHIKSGGIGDLLKLFEP
jgi:hypothetical protein